jgi:hypothetical protein
MPLTTYTSGEVLTAASLNANFSFAAAREVAVFNETQARNTAGGTAATGAFTKRVLNTTVYNSITGCSIASSVITLPAGTFLVTSDSPYLYIGRVKVKLRNTTAGTDAIIGGSAYTSPTTVDAVVIAPLTGTVVTTASTNFELQYHAGSANGAGNGLGVPSDIASTSEVYATITIEKIA